MTQSSTLANHPALQEFDKAASGLVVPFLENMDGMDAPELIFHYTNSAGLQGILQSGTVWLTDIFTLNDPSELAHGLAHAQTALKERAPTSKAAELFTDIFNNFQRHGVSSAIQVNVASFSDDGDRLGQWQMYGDDGLGFALAFHGPTMEKVFGWPGGRKHLFRGSFPMNYDEKLLADMHDEIVGMMADLIDVPINEGFEKRNALEFWRELSVLLSVHSLQLSTVFKHKAYAEEQEYRFMEFHGITNPAAGMKARRRGNEVVNYLEFDWRAEAPSALRGIVIGPACDKGNARQLIQQCIDVTSISISDSSIPYRASRLT